MFLLDLATRRTEIAGRTFADGVDALRLGEAILESAKTCAWVAVG